MFGGSAVTGAVLESGGPVDFVGVAGDGVSPASALWRFGFFTHVAFLIEDRIFDGAYGASLRER